MQDDIEIGFQAFTSDGGEEFGAVKDISAKKGELVVYVENAGEFIVPMSAIASVHSQKVIFHADKLDAKLREAIGHAHDAEEPGA